jgi:hypothetical protein
MLISIVVGIVRFLWYIINIHDISIVGSALGCRRLVLIILIDLLLYSYFCVSSGS